MNTTKKHTTRTAGGLVASFALFFAVALPASAALGPDNVAPVASADPCTTSEDTDVIIPVLANDVDLDSSLSIVEIDGVAVPPSGSVAVANGTATRNAYGGITFSPTTNFSGTTTFSYTVAEAVAAGAAGLSYHLESTTDNGPVVFTIDLTTGAKTVIGQLGIGGTTAMAYDEISGLLYFIRANGDLYSYDPHTATTTAALIGDIESTTAGWTDPVPATYSHQTASFYDGSLYLVPTARPAPTLCIESISPAPPKSEMSSRWPT